MTLSDEDRATLRSRYVRWGVDTVRRDLRRPLQHEFVREDVNKFARKWIEKTDRKKFKRERRKIRLVKLLMVVAVIEFGVAFGMIL